MGAVKRELAGRPRRDLLPIGTIVDMLTARIEGLCARLLPKGHREGNEWVEAKRAQGGLGDALHVNLSTGIWAHFAASNARGDALDLVAYIACGGDKGRAIQWSRAWLGIDSADPKALESARREAEKKAEAAQADAAEQARRKRARAWGMWLAAQAGIAETPVERYLAAERGIDLRALGRQPGALRYHPTLWNEESQRKWPAMLGLIGDAEGHFVAVHRTWLEILGDGRVRKAPLEEPKRTLGLYKGGAIRLWRGAEGTPLRSAGEGIIVDATEGIEDGLSVAYAEPALRVWAVVSLSNLANAITASSVAGVCWWAQNDPAGSKADEACRREAEKILAAGKRFLQVRMPAGVKDVNEYLRGDR